MSSPTRIAIPTNGTGGLDSQRSAHFGHSDSFTIVGIVDGEVTTADTIVNPPHASGGCGSTVRMLADAGATVAIVVGMGGGPRGAMESLGMTALFEDESPTPRAAAEAYLAGRAVAFGGDHVCSGGH